MQDILDHIATAHVRYQLPRPQHRTQLIAVSKTHGHDKIMPLIEQGQRVFGENKVQEAQSKFTELKPQQQLELHLIGQLQSNKIADACALFDVIHTLDRKKLADGFAKARDKGTALPQLLIQINTGEEPQKGGVLPQEAPEFINYCKTLALPVAGLMCIPPAGSNPAPHFLLLKNMAQQHNLKELSMGMSADYELATAMGATMVRVGSAIFGERNSSAIHS